jgi:hypothetical protein
MNSNQFYITLPSNSKQSNTTSFFETTLPQQISLEGNWECALVELIYPNNWDNVTTDQNVVKFFDVKNNTRQIVKIPTARYESVTDLIQSINDCIVSVGRREKVNYAESISLYFNNLKRSVQVTLQNANVVNFTFSDHIAYMLGFIPEQFKVSDPGDKTVIVAHHPPDILGGMHYLYIYCDILQPQIVGNTLAPLLGVVNVEGQYMQIVNRTYVAPHYIPVLKKCFNTIEINIKDDQNEFIKFGFGKTILKLHFKKVFHNYFG